MWFWGFVCVNQRDLRETLGFLLCQLIEYSHVNILPQMAQITQRNAAKLHYFAEKDRLGMVNADLRSLQFVVLGFVCINQRETLCFRLCGLIEYACMLFSRRWRRSRRRMQQSCIISQRKTDCS